LADFDELRNCEATQAFVLSMLVEDRPNRGADVTMKRVAGWCDPSPTQVGLSAALRRAFAMPADDTVRQFDELLRQLS
jgi:hypothetical protein